MRYIPRVSLMFCAVILTACEGGMPQLFWPVEDNKPAYTRSGGGVTGGPVDRGRAPLDIPPELRKEIEVPMPDQVAVNAARGDVKMSKQEKAAVAGKAVALDTRLYESSPAQVFSAVVDAMTALNLPVDSVDSPSGTITTEWIRPKVDKIGAYTGAALNIFGAGPVYTRHRFIVRVFRSGEMNSELQVRTLGQQFVNRTWVNRQIKRKVANELFSAIEERIGTPRKDTSPAAIDESAAGATPPSTNP